MERVQEPLHILEVVGALRESAQMLNPDLHQSQIETNHKMISTLLATINTVTLPAEVVLAEGELYAGGILQPDGTGYYLVLLPGDCHRLWEQQGEWAKEKGGQLPSRIELELLYKEFRHLFNNEFYASSEEFFNNENYYWAMNFTTGSTTTIHKNDWSTAVAIRRIKFRAPKHAI